MKSRFLILILSLLLAGLAHAQLVRRPAPHNPPVQVHADTVEDILMPGNPRSGPFVQSGDFPFPATVSVPPWRGWLHGMGTDFGTPGAGFVGTVNPGTLRLAPLILDAFLSRDFEDGLQGLYATGAFLAVHDTSTGYDSPSSARIDTRSTGAGAIHLDIAEYGTADYPEFEMDYRADPGFEGFTLIARVAVGSAWFEATLLDMRLDRLEDMSPPFDGEWHHMRVDVGGLLKAMGRENAVLKGLMIKNTTTASGPRMWIDNLRILGATYPAFAVYESPPHRMDQVRNFDTLYWARSRTIYTQPFVTYLEGDTGGGLAFQIRTADTRAGLADAAWYGPTSTNDWYTGRGMVLDHQEINPIHNGDRWMQVRVGFTSSQDQKHTPALEDFCVTWGDANVWDVLMLLMRSIDADYVDGAGNPGHETYTMPQTYVDDIINQWDFFTAYAPRFFNYCMKFNSVLDVVEEPVTEEHLSGSGSYTIDPYLAQPLYQEHLGDWGKWDSIMFHFRWEKVPFPAWGLAWWPNFLPGAAAMTQIIYIGPQYRHHEVMLHEWMHTFAWTVSARTDQFIPHPHYDDDPHWTPTTQGMDYYYHCLVWHGNPFAYESVDLVDAITAPFVNTFLSLGYFTFSTQQDDGLYIDYIGEDSANPWYGAEMGGKTWSQVTTTNGYINFFTKYTYLSGTVAYGDVYINSPTDHIVKLWTGSSDGVRIWLNNDEVLDRHLHRSAGTGDDTTALRLGQGWNHLMLKVEHYSGQWGFYATIADNDGTPPNDLTVVARPAGLSGFENVLGTADLGVFADPSLARLRFEVVNPANGEVLCGRWVSPAPDGSFRIGPAPRGTWELRVSGLHWLTTSQSITVGTGDLEGVSVELVNGDADGDNAVDLMDLTQVLLDLGKYAVPDSDLDGSGQVDLGDLNVVLTNFGQVGS